jgi:ABC-type phosphate transport system substrate-binding protein
MVTYNSSMQRGTRFGIFVLIIGFAVHCSAKQLAVVAEKGNATAALTSVNLAKILKAQTRTWPDGSAITVVIREPGSPDMQIVRDRLYKNSPDELKALIISHKGFIVVASSDEDLLHIVETTRGAIGLVDVYSITHGVKVLKIDDLLPLEAGYLLRGK